MMDAADRLRRYMDAHAGGKQEVLAEQLRVRQSQVSAWLLRRRRPGLRHAFPIQRLTGIKAESWGKVEITRPKAREGRAA